MNTCQPSMIISTRIGLASRSSTAIGFWVLVFDTTKIDLEPSGNKLGLYLSTRMRLFQPLTTEIGLRYDRASWTDDKKISPRLNLVYALTSQTSLRVGWGKFYQSQGIHELQVQDGDQEFYPATLAKHRVIGFEQRFNSGVNLRVEAYEKEISSRRPRYQNLSNQLEAFPEVEEDRIRLQPESGKSKGIEFSDYELPSKIRCQGSSRIPRRFGEKCV